MSPLVYASVLLLVPIAYFLCRKVSPSNRQFKKPNARYETTECNLCIDDIKDEAQLSCGHLFCATCILSVWEHVGGKLKCPMCRQEVDMIFPNFAEADANSTKAALEISKYNCMFSAETSNLRLMFTDSPLLFRKFFHQVFRSTGFNTFKLLFILLILALAYLFSPLDLISESVYGAWGFIDDTSILLGVLNAIIQVTFKYYVRRARERANAAH
mmetsp:Transcript_23919/g.42378  ORF Transcript_23919/g.42378 Transcript_23919/m.42378 type:complete len:214 (-) Transcript_23919:214-855(-)